MNTLIKELKGTINNDALNKLGEISVICKTKSTGKLDLAAKNGAICVVKIVSDDVTVTAVGGNGVIINSKEVQLPSTGTREVTFSAANTDVLLKISNKYELEQLPKVERLYENDAFQYMNSLKDIQIESDYDGVPINISSLKNNSVVVSLVLCTENISGDVSELGGMTSMTSAYFINTAVEGSIESFVAAQRTAGRTSTSSSIVFYCAGSRITFNGSLVTTTGSALSWTTNTITYNGVTINA